MQRVESFQDDVRARFRRGDSEGVLRIAEAELQRAEEPAGQVEALYAMARVALRGDDLPRAEELAQEALRKAAGDRRLEERPRHVLAAVARMSGDYPVARERYLASIALNEELGDPGTAGTERYNLGFVELRLGHVGRARELFARVPEGPYLWIAAAALRGAEGDHRGAAEMAGRADRAYGMVGQVPDPDDARELDRVRAAAVAALGEEDFAAAYGEGTRGEPDVEVRFA